MIGNKRVDDIPLVLRQMEQLKLSELVDQHFTQHGNWQGLSVGKVVKGWLAYLLSQGDHRLNQVESWAASLSRTLESCLGSRIHSPEISFTKQPINGGMVFQFRHKSLGELGRLVLQDRADGYCHITSEVVGDPDDPMTKTRSELFLPISEQLTAAIKAATSAKGRPPASTPTQVKTPPAPMERIPSRPLFRHGEILALLNSGMNLWSSRYWHIPKLEIVNQQSDGMLQHH